MRNAKLSSKGQVTIPKEIRDYLQLHIGDHLQFIIDRKGKVILTAQTEDVRDLYGALKVKIKRKNSSEEMDRSIGRAVKRKFLRASHRH